MSKESTKNEKEDEVLSKVMHYYMDENIFYLSPSNKELLTKIKQILSKYPFDSYIKYISSPQEHKTFILFLDCLLLRNQNPEDLFILIKYMTTFGEESLSILKIISHLNLIKIGKISLSANDIRVKIKLKNAEGLFGVKSSKKEKLPFNSYVQFTGNILNVSIIKKINTKAIYECPFCGIIGISNLDFGKNNKNELAPDKSHRCNESENNINNNGEIRIHKIFCEPIYVRYLLVQTEFGEINCLVLEEDFQINFLNKKELMFEGIVKSKQFNDKQNSNIYKKYVKLINIYEINKNSVSFELKSNMLINQNKTLSNLSNFVKQKKKFKLCYKLLRFKKVDFNNLLFFYYLFSLSNNISYNLHIHIVNLSKNELSCIESIKRINEYYPNLFKFINNETISHRIISKNGSNSEVFQNYLANSNLVINNYDNQYMTQELKNIINNLNSYLSCFDSCQNKNETNISNIIYNPNIYSSIFTMSNSFCVDLKGYDVISIVNDINTSNNDPYLANKAIMKEFDKRKNKRNYNTMNSLSERIFKNKFDFQSIKDDLVAIDSISFEEFFEQIIKNKEAPKNDNNSEAEKELDIEQYINFVNEYVNPTINPDLFEDIYFLSEHIKEQFDDLQAFTLYDINWMTVSTLQKFSKISARIDLREYVNKDDVIKGYFMTKEFLQKIYVHVLMNKTAKARGKGNKAKIDFVLEKLRQYMNISGDKISEEEIKSFGFLMSHEYDKLIDQLNMQGILMKVGTREYQILLD